MKRILTMILVAVILVAFSGCGKDTSLSDIENKKVLIAGFDVNHAPFGYQTENGEYAGFDLDLAHKIAEKLDATLNIHTLDDEDASDLLEANKVDIIAGNQSLLIGDDRGMTASDVLFVNKIVVAVRAGAGIENIGQLEEKNVGVVLESAAEEAFEGKRELKSKVDKKEFEIADEALSALVAGDVDAIVADEMFIRSAVKDGASVLMLDEPLEERSYSIMVAKGDKELEKKINEILFELSSDGTLHDLCIKWFGADVITLKS